MIKSLQPDVVVKICGLFTKCEFKRAGYHAVIAEVIVYILFFFERNHYARCKLASNCSFPCVLVNKEKVVIVWSCKVIS